MNKALACHCEPKAKPGHEVGCVFAIDFKHKDGDSFISDDAYGHLCTNYGSKWQLDGRYFDGVDDYVDCGAMTNYLTTSIGRIEAWVNFAGTGRRSVVGIGRQDAAYYFIDFHINEENRAVGYMEYAGGTQWNIHSSVLDAGWHHIVLRQDGVKVRQYVDGVENGTHSDGANHAKWWNAFTPRITYIGAFSGKDSSVGPKYYFNGLIAEVRIYNFADYSARILSRRIGG